MSDQVQIRLMAGTPEQLAAAVARLGAAGIDVTWERSALPPRYAVAYGFFALYDKPRPSTASSPPCAS